MSYDPPTSQLLVGKTQSVHFCLFRGSTGASHVEAEGNGFLFAERLVNVARC